MRFVVSLLRRRCGPALFAALLSACATPALDEAAAQARAGAHRQAYETLRQAAAAAPADPALRAALLRQRERLLMQGLAQADLARAAGRLDDARRLLDPLRELDPQHARLIALEREIERSAGHATRLDQARRAAEAGRSAAAEALLRDLLAEAPGHPGARALRTQLATRAAAAASAAGEATPAAGLGAAFQKPVSLEFRDAPLRQVFEALARTTAVNFVFDKDVRGDVRVTVFLRNVTLDEAIRIVLATQALDRKLLNDSTVLVYPNTPAKQREHQELVTRSLYLRNAEAKNVLPLVRSMAKTRDLHADERLNALVLRDTPEVVRLVEQLVATIDLPEPEVVLDVEVLELASDRLDELGLQWPGQISYGVPGASGQVPIGDGGFRGLVVTPAVVANLRGQSGTTQLLANPSIRARQREKAKVQIGEKLPVFTTTSTANVGVSTSVSYLDVGLKLDVEPSVQLDGEVVIRVALEVSNLLREVSGPAGALAYQVGTRTTTTSLRLADGETQILAGLINDEDRRRATGIPGLAQLPLVGRLFGSHGDTRNKTEIVMLITPRIVRSLALPDARDATLASGTDALPGAASLRLRPQGRAGVGPARAAGADSPAAATGAAGAADPTPDSSGSGAGTPTTAALVVSASGRVRVGEPASVGLVNRSAFRVRGELLYDERSFEPASAVPGAGAGRLPFTLEARGETALLLRPRAAAAAQTHNFQVTLIEALSPAGDSADLRIEGQARVEVLAAEVPR